MAQYRKKPVVIEAFQWLVDITPQWWIDRVGTMIDVSTEQAIIPTLEGNMRADRNDFIIKGIQGEMYPCKPDIFEATYEKVD